MSNIVEVQIEVPKGSNVKYEIDHLTNKLKCDRILHGPFKYSFNYGFINDTLSLDGDPIDAVVICDEELYPTCYVTCKIIGALITEDEKGGDDKLILVPYEKVDPLSRGINDISDLTPHKMDEIEYFFTHYKDMEPGKFVKVQNRVSSQEAIEIYEQSKLRYKNNSTQLKHN